MPAPALRLNTAEDFTAPTGPAEAPLLLDAIEAARLLNISPRTLWQFTKDGAIRAKRIGRRILYSRAALEEFANSK